MIVLMGGTSESAEIAEALANAGFSVLVSMATEVPLALPAHPGITLRRGRLTLPQLVLLLSERRASALVDAMHPYAAEAHGIAKQAAQQAGIPYLRYLREESDLSLYPHTRLALSHEEAAQQAVSLGRTILLTIGSRNLLPYVSAARKAGLGIHARVLPCQESEQACQAAGLKEQEVTRARGPFGVQETLDLLRRTNAGTLVTKESGRAGGVPEKLKAAELAQCAVVVVRRAVEDSAEACRSTGELISRLCSMVQAEDAGQAVL